MKTVIIALLCGLLFGAGLTYSGMASPAKVLGFLTLGPGWDPSLIFVMGGALAISLPGFWWLRRKQRPWLAESFSSPASNHVDGRLLAGAAVFGLGWGLAGFCPGPALVSIGFFQGAALLFVPAMFAGAVVAGFLRKR
ncbi:MAG: DUF6691 family protein [Pseudomonadota bacterium]